jgi:hypothetical protein
MSASGPLGPYEHRVLISNAGHPVSRARCPRQKDILDTPSGYWYYMVFVDI